MTTTFAIPDLHGRFDPLCAAERAIADRVGHDRATVVMLGDYVNKGPQSADVLAHLIGGLSPRWQLICLKGNHDAIMLDALHDPANMPRWLENGGAATLRSYGEFNAAAPDAAVVPVAHRQWLEGLQLIHVDVLRVFVHAGVDPSLPLDRQSEATLLWKRYAEDDPLA